MEMLWKEELSKEDYERMLIDANREIKHSLMGIAICRTTAKMAREELKRLTLKVEKGEEVTV